MFNIKFTILIFVLLAGFSSCSSEPKEEVPEKKSEAVKIDAPLFDINAVDHTPGIAGVFEVPEMWSLCKLDSAKMADVGAKVISGFAVLEQEMIATGAELNGPQGIIYYDSNPNNFKFETVLLIKEMPKKTPKNCQIVILEASYMLVYNYVGPYENISKSYDVIKKYMDHNGYQQSGRPREFYPEVPGMTSDPSKLLTKILVPVIKKG